MTVVTSVTIFTDGTVVIDATQLCIWKGAKGQSCKLKDAKVQSCIWKVHLMILFIS